MPSTEERIATALAAHEDVEAMDADKIAKHAAMLRWLRDHAFARDDDDDDDDAPLLLEKDDAFCATACRFILANVQGAPDIEFVCDVVCVILSAGRPVAVELFDMFIAARAWTMKDVFAVERVVDALLETNNAPILQSTLPAFQRVTGLINRGIELGHATSVKYLMSVATGTVWSNFGFFCAVAKADAVYALRIMHDQEKTDYLDTCTNGIAHECCQYNAVKCIEFLNKNWLPMDRYRKECADIAQKFNSRDVLRVLGYDTVVAVDDAVAAIRKRARRA